MNRIALVVCVLLLSAAPGWASTFQIYEDSLGGPGVTAQFPTGSGLVADIDFDADSAEAGGLLLGGPSEIDITPTGSVVFVAFTCQLAGCTAGVDYFFTPGGAGTGSLLLSDPDADAHSGIYEMGDLTFNAASLGTIELNGCNYTDGGGTERTCDPFTLVNTVPEPASGALLGLALFGLGFARRMRR
jgi:PEP-CTERM motif-containing protein